MQVALRRDENALLLRNAPARPLDHAQISELKDAFNLDL